MSLNKFFFILIIVISFSIGACYFLIEKDWIDLGRIENYDTGKPSIILDQNNEEIFRFQLDKKDPVSFEKLPNILIRAFLAAEDWNFFNHPGISIKGILRSLVINIYHRKVIQGASTITQQLVKLIFLSCEKTFLRKLQEMFLAFQVERQFTKEQILELYLNNMYFGRGIYGVQTACNRFWNKSVCDINLEQAATLAAVAKSARFYSPLNSISGAKSRRNVILNSMLKLNFITHADYKKAITKNIDIKDYIPGNPIRLYIYEWIRSWAEEKWGKDTLYKKGLKIKTTINKELQEQAENIFHEKIKKVRSKIDKELNGGMICLDAQTGKIRAAIGGYDFKESQYNRTFQASRQIGSAFKPFLYTCALLNNINMYDTMVDEPLELELTNKQIYKPRNWTRDFEGSMTLLRALTLSNNIIAVKLFLKIGPQKVLNFVKTFGIKEELYPYPSAALGTAQATVEQLAAAFNTFANCGVYVKPILIEWVKDEWNSKIWESEIEKKFLLDSKTNSIMVNALSYRIKRAYLLFGRPKDWIQTEAIGKTGATNNASSMWFAGSTPEFTTCIYVGRDDNKSISSEVFASKVTFPIWLEFNKKINSQKKHFYIDPELKEINIDWITGEQTDSTDQYRTVKVLK